ncbi:hypothetical protein AAFF_G00176540 [Aldrovandia affinis]|uniref:Uncharacterized protein n=1 Tax=Aldrovandia affinis TaxID=143900 RepID=A0AAD7RKV1_9TELE|nr:hypothetical protein AAFF_G00176540 [Aldrovandia affinis]
MMTVNMGHSTTQRTGLLTHMQTDDGVPTEPGLHRNSQDDEEALHSIMKDLAALGRCYTQRSSGKPQTKAPLLNQDLRIKLEHEGEKRILLFQRPLKFRSSLRR